LGLCTDSLLTHPPFLLSRRRHICPPAPRRPRLLAIKSEHLLALGPLYCEWEWRDGTAWVAKENKRVESDLAKEVEFHEKALLTQV
jgi:hypothetical protein